MSDVVQCPTCNKKFRLPPAPPPTFTCSGCGTVLDLSAFQAPAQPAQPAQPAAPVQPKAPAGRRAGGRRGGRAAAAPHTTRRPGHRKARAGRGSHAAEDDGYEGGERPHYSSRDKGPNMPLILGSLALGIGAIVVAVVVFMKEEKQLEKPPETVVAQQPAANPMADLPDEPIPDPDDVVPESTTDKPEKPKDVELARPELSEGSYKDVPLPEGKENYRWSQATIKTYPYPDHVTAEEKNKIEEAINGIVEIGGRDLRDGTKYLVALDAYADGSEELKPGEEFKAVGRVISEFKNILDNNDINDRLTMAKLMSLDMLLRKIDGMQEREFKEIDPIRHASDERHAMRVIKRWNWWYDLEKWRMRRVPYDPREDQLDADLETE